MTNFLPSDGQERTLFLRALRQYSNGCEMPELTPGCPFFRVDPRIGAWCGEECMDVLGRFPFETGGLVLDGDLRAVRLTRRARRSSDQRRPPFDAQQQFFEDSVKPYADRRPASLLTELRDLLMALPVNDPTSTGLEMAKVLRALSDLGLDGQAMLDSVLLADLARSIAVSVALPAVLATNTDSEEIPQSLWESIPGWPEALLAGIIDVVDSPASLAEIARQRGQGWTNELVRSVLFDDLRASHEWLRRLSTEDLLARRAPTAAQLSELAEVHPPEPSDDLLWMMDRFTMTYLADWDQESLLREFRYQHGECAPPCGSEAMASRPVNVADLSAAIAHNAAAGHDGRKSRLRTADSLVLPALDHLDAGEPRLAAALFEAQRVLFPEDARAHNNYGFCMMPLDQREALAALERAASMGLAMEPVNIANRMVLLNMGGRATTALAIAERYANSTAWERRSHGYLWDWNAESTDWKVRSVDDVRRYVGELACQISSTCGDDMAARRWGERLSSLV